MDIILVKGPGESLEGSINDTDAYVIDTEATEKALNDKLDELYKEYMADINNIEVVASWFNKDPTAEKAARKAQYVEDVNSWKLYYSQNPIYKVNQDSNLIGVEENKEAALLKRYNSLDIEIGVDTNTFELKINMADSKYYGINYGDYIYIPGTEYGGVIEKRQIDTSVKEMSWSGTTWRGLLQRDYICPASYETDGYVDVSGDLNAVVHDILWRDYGACYFFDWWPYETGVTVSDYRFNRYISKLDGLSKLLASKGYKLKIYADIPATHYFDFKVNCKAVPIVNYAESVEYSTDNRVDIKITEDRGGVNHLICLGAGDLAERDIVHIWIDQNGGISTTTGDRPSAAHKGVKEIAAIYDYGSIEGDTAAAKHANLIAAGKTKILELRNYQEAELTVNTLECDIYDTVGVREKNTGTYFEKTITNKILRKTPISESVEIKIGEIQEETDAVN